MGEVLAVHSDKVEEMDKEKRKNNVVVAGLLREVTVSNALKEEMGKIMITYVMREVALKKSTKNGKTRSRRN